MNKVFKCQKDVVRLGRDDRMSLVNNICMTLRRIAHQPHEAGHPARPSLFSDHA
jgi:hypothetical protein